jgi:hypothetical protein
MFGRARKNLATARFGSNFLDAAFYRESRKFSDRSLRQTFPLAAAKQPEFRAVRLMEFSTVEWAMNTNLQPNVRAKREPTACCQRPD